MTRDDLIAKYRQECPKCEGSGRWVFNCFQAGDQSVEEIEDCPDCARLERLIREAINDHNYQDWRERVVAFFKEPDA